MDKQTDVVNLPRLIEIINLTGGSAFESHIGYNDVNVTNGRGSTEWLATLVSELRSALHIAEAAYIAADHRQYSREQHIAKAAGVNTRTGLLDPPTPPRLDLSDNFPKIVANCGNCAWGIWRPAAQNEGWLHDVAEPTGCKDPAPK